MGVRSEQNKKNSSKKMQRRRLTNGQNRQNNRRRKRGVFVEPAVLARGAVPSPHQRPGCADVVESDWPTTSPGLVIRRFRSRGRGSLRSLASGVRFDISSKARRISLQNQLALDGCSSAHRSVPANVTDSIGVTVSSASPHVHRPRSSEVWYVALHFRIMIYGVKTERPNVFLGERTRGPRLEISGPNANEKISQTRNSHDEPLVSYC